MIISLLLLLQVFASAASAGCPPLGPLLDEVEARFGARAFPDALESHRTATAALECGQRPTRDELVRYWLADGALHYVQDQRNEAIASLAAASRLNPGLWVMAYGDDLRRVYERASVGVSGTGRVDLAPPPPAGLRASVDGTPQQIPATVDAGLHLLQLLDGSTAVYAGVIAIPEDELVTVRWTTEPEPAPKQPGSGPPPWLIGAGGAAVLSAAAATGALSQNGAMRRAESVDAVEAAYGRQVGFAVTSYGLAGLAATGLVLHVAL